MNIIPLHIGVQWAWAKDGTSVFSPSAHSANMGGSQRIGPRGGDRLLRAMAWQSSVKIGHHEVLLHLVCSPEGNGLGEGGQITILSTHHIGNEPASVIRDVSFGEHGLLLPADYTIWVYGEGGPNGESGWDHPAPVEIQTALYVTDVN